MFNTYSLQAKFPDYQVFNGTQGIRFFLKIKKKKKLKKFFTLTFVITPIGRNSKGSPNMILKNLKKLSEGCY